MTVAGTGDELRSLRARAEQALQRDLPREHVRGLLEALAERASDDSPEACFANRHLAELLLEESPWRAALHLRRLLKSSPEDDAAHALMGLSQALQGNYRMAVSSFRRAVAVSPSNPWYHHNLGHLLDVALCHPQEALPHLQRAFRAQPSQEEVGASYAQCLGRLGRCAEGLQVVTPLLQRHPRHADLLALKSWLERGAPPGSRGAVPGPRNGPKAQAVDTRCVANDAIRAALRLLGRDEPQVEHAVRAWGAYVDAVTDAAPPDHPTIAALDYVAARKLKRRVTQKHIAQEHDVTPNALAARYARMRPHLPGA